MSGVRRRYCPRLRTVSEPKRRNFAACTVGTAIAERRGMTRHHSFRLVSSTLALLLATACGTDEANPGTGGGGQPGAGGSNGGSSNGGSSGKGTGGASNGTGGATAGTGGASNGTGGSSDAGPGTGGANAADGSAGGSPSTGGAAATGGATGTGGAVGDAAAACNSIENVGNDVSEQHVTSGSPEAMTGGGPVPDGTYMLIQRQDFQGSCGCLQKRTFNISGNVVNFVTRDAAGAPEQRVTGTVTYSGNELTITFTCGPAQFLGQSMTLQYTVSSGGGQTVYKTYDTNGGKSQIETYLKVPATGCTDLTSNTPITSQAGVGTYPTPAGGTIADGTYILSKYELYPPTAITPITRRSAFRFSGTTIEAFEVNETSGFSTKGKGTISFSGTNFTLTGTCPPGGGFTKPYTATANEFIWFETDGSNKFEIWTYTKQ